MVFITNNSVLTINNGLAINIHLCNYIIYILYLYIHIYISNIYIMVICIAIYISPVHPPLICACPKMEHTSNGVFLLWEKWWSRQLSHDSFISLLMAEYTKWWTWTQQNVADNGWLMVDWGLIGSNFHGVSIVSKNPDDHKPQWEFEIPIYQAVFSGDSGCHGLTSENGMTLLTFCDCPPLVLLGGLC